MTNNLRKIAQELRAFARRTKSFRYTRSSLITFLITRLVFPAQKTDSDVQTQFSQLNSSISSLMTDFRKARKENEKSIKNSSLELVQLMEQGEHVIKSKWPTWQIGTAYTYNSWLGEYSGREDKEKSLEGRIFGRVLGRSRYMQSISGGTYGATALELTDTAESSIEKQ